MMSAFPGSTSVSFLEVYSDLAPDGIRGGTPHMHLVSTEAYLVIAGRGAVQTITSAGFAEQQLSAGSVVWFTPGTIHRAVNYGALQMVVLMSNAGLPEAGDAVMTFPPEVVTDPDAYARAAGLGATDSDRPSRAAQRRDRAVHGFLQLKGAIASGDQAALTAFYQAAASLVRSRAPKFTELIAAGPLAQAERSLAASAALALGDGSWLLDGYIQQAEASSGEPRFGMCGRLRTYTMPSGDGSGGAGQPGDPRGPAAR